MLIRSIAHVSILAGTWAAVSLEPLYHKSLGGGCFEVVFDGATIAALDAVNNTKPTWECDVRVWTRAPDLSPGRVIPADARLAANGSACGDIVKWEVGMRLKERALIKMKEREVELPPKPIRPVWNETRMRKRDHNDVFGSTMFFSHQDPAEREYEDAMEVYHEQLRNASLWFVRGEERVVYDVKREVNLQPTKRELVELTEAFAIHMPWTNFPPLERTYSSSTGKDNQILTTETLSEFYHMLTLSNGTVLDLPSGDIGISPVNSAVKPSADIKQSSIGDMAWPQTVHFEPTFHNTSESHRADPDAGYIPMAPSCDDGNSAAFTLSVDSNVTQPVLGQNITLNFTLTRTGNGSEYPGYIDVAHATDVNITWAYQFVSNESDYLSLQTTSGRSDSRHIHGAPFQRMKLAPTARELQEAKERKEERMNGSRAGRAVYMDWMMRNGHVHATHDLWDDEKEPQEVYNFGMEITLPENDYPSFEKTFESARSSLAFTLHTYFACDAPSDFDDSPAGTSEEEETQAIPKLEKEWEEYELPVRKSKHARMKQLGMARYRQHRLMPLDAAVPVTGPAAQAVADVEVLHYLDESARGPALTAHADDAVNLPILAQQIRVEAEEQHKKVLWGHGYKRAGANAWCKREGAGRRCYEQNGGGGGKLASRMWQSKEAREREASDRRVSDDAQKSSFVIQAYQA